MKKISTTKISLQSSNPTFSYPLIRLPREYKELAGRVATIYQTEIGGVQGFFVAPHLDNLDNFFENYENANLSSAAQNELKTKGRGRDSNPRRGLHRAIG